VASFNRRCGVDVHEIDAKEVQRLFPLARTDDVLAGFYVKDDGRVNPIDAAMALAKGARLFTIYRVLYPYHTPPCKFIRLSYAT